MKREHIVIIWAVCGVLLGTSVSAQTTMSVEQQNAIVQKHCAVCHNDAANNGGLTLQHFDATAVAPSLAAMMLSKLTGGLPLDTVTRASSDPTAKTQVSKQLQGGAIMAAGIAPPDDATTFMLATTLASQAKSATVWHMGFATSAGGAVSVESASLLREVRRKPDMAESYRLVLTCDTVSREGSMQLAWSPEPRLGSFTATVDGTVHGPYRVEGKERMGNGVGTSGGLAAYVIPNVSLPSSALIVRDLFPGETVEFGFGDLSSAARQALAPCFMAGLSAPRR
jgi:hypothetical protein